MFVYLNKFSIFAKTIVHGKELTIKNYDILRK